ncbi:PQQ-dependent sugar dehydrogenase [Sorangium sp. So ce834]|uniref:PQQ-dependent sugar dehydrogenase n=1 Tax=Sorangium sp. So ce834 TaxID=3133321 RepID=UPI003F5E43F7
MKRHGCSRYLLTGLATLALFPAGCIDDPGADPEALDTDEAAAVTGAPLTSVASGKCLDVKGRSTTPGTGLQIYTCNGQDNQSFNFTSAGELQVYGGTRCVEPANGATTAGTKAVIASCSGQARQKWTRSSAGAIIHQPSGLCLDVEGRGTTNGTAVQLWTCNNQMNQQWSSPVEVDDQPPTAPTNLTGAASGTSVTLRWTAATDNVAVTAYDVYRNGAKVGTVPGTASSPPATTFVDSGLSSATAYTYHVIALDAQSNASPASGSTSVTTGSTCSSAVCEVVQVATDTDLPWGLVSLPDGTVLYSRRDADDIVQLNPSTGAKTSIGTVPNVAGTDGEGGLMGLAIAPTFEADRWLYIMHTSSTDNRIVRIKVVGNRLDTSTEQVLISGIPRNKYHNGGRLRWGPDGKLYATTGDAQNGNLAQDTSSLAGKILRLEPDGRVPSDNPFGNYVWSYGHRNPQGLAFDSTGRLWEQEFGNTVMDETNLIQKGGNYGWPNCEGTVSQGGSGCSTAGYIAPKLTYRTAEGSCSGIAIVDDVFYAACQRGTRMYRAVISGSSLTSVQQLFVGTYGRLRTVEPTLDGNLWLTTTNTGGTDSVPNNSDERIFRVILGN